MIPPQGAEIIDTELSTYWVDKNGILCSVVKGIPFTIERMEENFKLVKEITGNKKACVLVDLSQSLPVEKDARMFAAGVVADYYKAMAFISPSPFTRIIGNAFIVLAGSPVPSKQFKNEKDAREWLMRYLS